jgi:hypothetical protein
MFIYIQLREFAIARKRLIRYIMLRWMGGRPAYILDLPEFVLLNSSPPTRSSPHHSIQPSHRTKTKNGRYR